MMQCMGGGERSVCLSRALLGLVLGLALALAVIPGMGPAPLAYAADSQPKAAAAAAAAPLPDRMDAANKAWDKSLNAIEAALGKPGLSGTDKVLDDYAARLRAIREDVTSLNTEATQRVGETERLLSALGPPPDEEQGPEPADIRQRRTTYTTDLATWRARVAKAEVASTRAEALLGRIAAFRRNTLVSTLFDPTPEPWSSVVLSKAADDTVRAVDMIVSAPGEWFSGGSATDSRSRTLGLVALWGAAGIVLGLGGRWWVLRRFGRRVTETAPTYAQRTLGALAEGLANGLLPALLMAGMIAWAQVNLQDDDLLRHLVSSTFLALLVLVAARAFTRAALAPGLPDWRLTTHNDAQAVRLSRIIQGLSVVLAIDVFLLLLADDFDPTPETLWLVTSGLKLMEGAILVRLSGRDLWSNGIHPTEEAATGVSLAHDDDESALSARRLLWLGRGLVLLTAIVGMLAGLFGYGRLGSFLINGLLASCALMGGALIVRGVLRDLTGLLTRSAWLRTRLGWGETGQSRAGFWMRATIDIGLLLGLVYLGAPVWGVPSQEVVDTVVTLLTGIKVGSVTISVVDISVGIGVFLGAMAFTRMIQSTLQRKVLVQTGMDPGVRHSLTTGLGYLGAIVASALAVATMGIDLTNVALIAGALSVGIGFGLQNIVNNFVSGLIILVERPIKVGDWVIINGNEGLVKRISFRATELETFTQAAIILPNAEILSRPFTNLTHRNRLGRIDVAVGVAYGSDTDLVKKVLLEVINAHEQVLPLPAPWVVFKDFGDSALIFEVRAYTANVMNRMSIASDLRYGIDRRFREENISIPFPHRVLVPAAGSILAPVSLPAQPPGAVSPHWETDEPDD
ncbi:mechanosensitive ion channel family protein [Pararhodospirillum oryzae]|uniref:Mechanosensitive ion channel protein MscS n=1 Tax=Pararhodospirillum oryzae TaxID=478448 RepID=A0A512H3K4_9PROT|nr:mechanosensitive ion channel domain-containing protein [Pararhodospirillum oryzae]GEO79988.1 mechanosensitive ion channel protein MscS [Pararhodospirillum oryzae]